MAGPQPQYMPPPPPPPPPNFAYGEGFMRKPTSGKAVASLVCGLAGTVGTLLCVVFGVAAPVGVVLGILGIIETGKEGPRSGRGLAIAGTIVSSLAIVAVIAVIGFAAYMFKIGSEEAEQHSAAQLDKDQQLIMEKLRAYYDQNDQSLGPGGPILGSARYDARYDTRPANDGSPAVPRVTGVLTLEHLVSEESLSYGGRGRGGGMGWELVVTGKSSATLRATDWDGEIVREVVIRDIGRNDYSETVR